MSNGKASVTQILGYVLGLPYQKAIELTLKPIEARIGKELTTEHVEFARIACDYFVNLASNSGRKVHSWLFDELQGRKPALPEKGNAKLAAGSLSKWLSHEGKDTWFSQIEPHLEDPYYAGHPDFLGGIYEAEYTSVVDLKLTNEPQIVKWRLQTAAYHHLAGLDDNAPRYIIWVNKSDKKTMPVVLYTFEPDTLSEDLHAWTDLLNFYYWKVKFDV